MSWRRCAIPREQDNIHNPAITVDSFFSILMFIGCFSAATIAAAAEIPAGGGYSSVLAGGDYQTEAEVMVGFQTVAVGCANYSGGLTICYDAYEVVSIPPWSDFGDWAWSRIVETRIPVRRTVNGIDGGTNYEYTTGRIVLRYFCPAGYPQFTQSESTWQPGTAGRPTCTDGLVTPPPPAVCSVDVLTPYDPDPYPLDIDNLTPRMQTALQCLQTAIANNGGTSNVESAYRPPAYNQHLIDVWNKWVRELRNNTNPACQTLRADVQAHIGRHELLVSQPPVLNSLHTQGEAFDLTSSLPYANLDALTQGCQVYRNIPVRDPVHFIHR